uniref:Secreted protein n=1 Tax=Romanomermis culicivorax TaxID=13658 RepID=A0A915HRD4_ROMCU
MCVTLILTRRSLSWAFLSTAETGRRATAHVVQFDHNNPRMPPYRIPKKKHVCKFHQATSKLFKENIPNKGSTKAKNKLATKKNDRLTSSLGNKGKQALIGTPPG